jgi:hypothetical protein
MKKSYLSLFLILLLSNSVQAQQSLFEYESVQSFSPDFSANQENKPAAAKNVSQKQKQDYKFQLADPKNLYLPPKKASTETKENKTTLTISDNNKLKKAEDILPACEVVTETNQELKERMESQGITELEASNKTETTITKKDIKETFTNEPPELKPQKTLLEEARIKTETSLPDVPETPDIDPGTTEETKNIQGAKSESVPDEKTSQPEDIHSTEDGLNTNEEDIRIEDIELIDTVPETVIKEPADVFSFPAENNEIVIKKEPTSEATKIDYYLKKYGSTLEAGANITDYQYSLMEPFRQSLFYTLLKENQSEDIELQTSDITSDFQPEAIVSYNVPLGAEGEYACQVMVLEPTDPGLTKLWVSEQIPGEIDSVMIQDVNNDAQKDIVSVSTSGGVSLLKSVRVYSFDKAKNTFVTIFSMNGIMEGIVNVRPGKILISETFPGGINRAALYVWNGRRFERLEL